METRALAAATGMLTEVMRNTMRKLGYLEYYAARARFNGLWECLDGEGRVEEGGSSSVCLQERLMVRKVPDAV